MSGTRSPSPKAPATEPGAALVVAHGSPSAPGPAEDAIRRLAAEVSELLPGRRVLGATLAAPGALAAAVAASGDAAVVYPLFMADGWFVREALPARLEAAGCRRFTILPPFGRDPAVHALCLGIALEAAAGHALRPAETTLVLAAHGSPADPRPRAATREAAAAIAGAAAFREVRTGFVDEAPYLAEAARCPGPALCLPFFATRAGHVERDLPQALRAAGFPGWLLDPVGTDPRVPAIIAAALRRRLRPAGRTAEIAAGG